MALAAPFPTTGLLILLRLKDVFTFSVGAFETPIFEKCPFPRFVGGEGGHTALPVPPVRSLQR